MQLQVKLVVEFQVREYAPEVLIVAPCGADAERARDEACQLAGLPGWWNLPAVRTGRVYVCDHSFFSRPGPRRSPYQLATPS